MHQSGQSGTPHRGKGLPRGEEGAGTGQRRPVVMVCYKKHMRTLVPPGPVAQDYDLVAEILGPLLEVRAAGSITEDANDGTSPRRVPRACSRLSRPTRCTSTS